MNLIKNNCLERDKFLENIKLKFVHYQKPNDHSFDQYSPNEKRVLDAPPYEKTVVFIVEGDVRMVLFV